MRLPGGPERRATDRSEETSEPGSPRVSAIVTTHNRAELLPRAVDSVLSQTYRDLELIIVDDCSSDNTPEVVAGFDDRRIRSIRHPDNRRPSAARNTGIASARGEYIAFLDDDDEWLPAKLEKQVALLDSQLSRVGLVYGWLDEVDDSTGRTRPSYRRILSGDASVELLALHIPSPTSTLLVRTRAVRDVDGWDESLRMHTDLDFICRIAQRYHVAVLPEVVVTRHVMHGYDRVSDITPEWLAHNADYLRRHLDRYSTELSQLPQARASVFLYLSRVEMLRGNTRSAFSALFTAVRLDPGGVCRTVARRGPARLRELLAHTLG